ncbi:MAG: galactose mutarotase [Chitinophagaceae bacterium]|nr:MAG: galactose mutarotase [Chitinophagaceae bacterium]
MALTHEDPRKALSDTAFQKTIAGKETGLYWISNGSITAAITNYGARLVALFAPDRDGRLRDLVVGFDNIDDYIRDKDYHGATVGRYANRIARGRFSLDEKEYTLAINNAPNHLHGGIVGFSAQVWDIVQANGEELELRLLSPDGDEGYPGNLDLSVRFRISDTNELSFIFEATCDAPTVLNVCNHAYWNLNGQGSGSAMEHDLFINAGHFTPVDEFLIPTGDLAFVTDTPFDFSKPARIGERIDHDHQQLVYGAGYDHNFVLIDSGEDRNLAAVATGNESGIRMAVYTTEPGIQLYTGNYLQALRRLKYGLSDERRSAFCLETQHFPDSPNKPEFPSVVLWPGETFQSRTDHVFLIAT